jgi:multiple sugar transport system permease protein
MTAEKTVGKSKINVLLELSILIAIVATLIPIIWIVILAFLPNKSIINSSFDFSFWLGNFRLLLDPSQNFARQIFNSLTITFGTMILTLAIGAGSGYSLSKLKPPKWATTPVFILASFLPIVPPITLVPGIYATLTNLHLLGSITGLILINTVFNLPFAILMIKSYFDQIPEELREAALVDGAPERKIFFSVLLPLAKPGFGAVGIYVAIMAWNEFLMGLIMTTGGKAAPLTVGIASLVQDYEITFGQMSAAGFVAAIPIIVLTAVASRQIVSGLTAGAVKS